MKRERFEAITDAVLAIIITLMVLEIRLPEFTAEHAGEVAAHIGIYAVSFIYIAILWLNHHHIFSQEHWVSVNLVWLNFAMLFFTSLFPMATEHMSLDFAAPANHIFFGAVIGLMSLCYTLLQHAVEGKADTPQKRLNHTRNWVAVGLFAASLPLSLVSVYISGAVFIVLPVMYFLLSKKVIR